MAQHFDIVVIGLSRPDLLCAALLAKRGARVLLVDHGETSPIYRRAGRPLPLIPTLMPIFDDAPQIDQVVKELAFGPELRIATKPLKPSFQAVMPEHRLDIRPDAAATLRELKLEFPEVREGLDHFFAALGDLDKELSAVLAVETPLPPSSLRERLRPRAFEKRAGPWSQPFGENAALQQIPEDHPVRDLVLSPLAFFGYLPSEQVSTFQAVRLLSRYFRGAVSFADPLRELTPILAGAARTAGVEVRPGAVVAQIRAEGGRLVEMQIAADRLPYRADFYVADTQRGFADLLPPGRPHQKLTADPQATRRVGALLTMNLVVKKEVIPRGMAEAVFLLNGRRATRGEDPVDPPVFLRRYPARMRGPGADANGQPDPEHEVLAAACPARLADLQHAPDRLAALRVLLFERVRRVVPFLTEHLTDRSFPLDTAQWDAEGEHRRADPLAAHPHFELAQPSWLGVAGRSPRTPIKNLVHLGRDLFPGLGVEGEFWAARLAADTVEGLAKHRWRRA